MTKHKRCRWKTNLKKLLDPSLGRAELITFERCGAGHECNEEKIDLFQAHKIRRGGERCLLDGKKKQFDVVMSKRREQQQQSSDRRRDNTRKCQHQS